MKNKTTLLVLVLFFYLLPFCKAQTDYSKPLNELVEGSVMIDSNHYRTIRKENGKTHITINNELKKQVKNDSAIRYVVQFKGNTVGSFIGNSRKMMQTKELHEETFTQFNKDFRSIVKDSKTKNTSELQIRHKFSSTYFGASVVATGKIVSELKRLNYIKNIIKAQTVHANLENSVPLIGADSVWLNLGFTGEGIKIGIIDSGIDFNHPDLGGGFGDGYKVAGGYDFANMDPTPSDQYGHGTHVAGIAAGNGTSLKGVAPDATLYAIQVLKSNGLGYADDIIAGIEYCVDPNGDGNYEDKLDVANMSLGGMGDSYDPMSTAVNNASEMGVVFCISAGNSGEEGNNTIGSPGTAQLAITVGATNNNDLRAYFSSNGPCNGSYSIKPEVMAPGYAINSTVPDNDYEKHSGTSMSSPHVAGLCALIKQAHPDWKHQEMKSALMTTAKDLNLSPFKQGAGRIQAMDAIEASTLVMPAHLSFGRINPIEPISTKQDTLLIVNNDSVSKNYQVLLDSTESGIIINTSLLDFVINPQDTVKIPFTITVNKDALPSDLTNKSEFSGFAHLVSDNESINIPWGFVQIKDVVINPHDNWEELFIIGKNSIMNFNLFDDSIATISIPLGTYSIIEITKEYEITIEQRVEINSIDTLNLITIETDNGISALARDENGTEIVEDFSCLLSINFSNINLSYPKFNNYRQIFFSNLDSTVLLGVYGVVTPNNNDNVYVISSEKNGLSQSFVFENDYNSFQEIKLNVQYPKEEYLKFKLRHDRDDSMEGVKRFNILESNWLGSAFIPKNNFINEYNLNYKIGAKIQSQDLRFIEDSIRFYFLNNPEPNKFVFENDIYNVKYKYTESANNTYLASEGPVKAFLCTERNRLDANGNAIIEAYLYNSGSNGEELYFNEHTHFILKDKQENTIHETNNYVWGFAKEVEPDKYSIEYTYKKPYKEFIESSTHIITNFDLRKEDKASPVITSLQIRNSEGIPTNLIYENEKAKIRFSVADFFRYDSVILIPDATSIIEQYVGYKAVNTDSIKLFIKQSDENQWQAIDFNILSQDKLIGYYMESDISHLTNVDSAVYDIRIFVSDTVGNNCIGTWSKCFYVNKCDGVIANNDYYYTTEGVKLSVSPKEGLLANDYTGFEYFGAYPSIAKSTNNGIIYSSKYGNITYYPNEGFIGTDTALYMLQNRFGDPDTAMIIIQVDSTLVNITELVEEQNISCYPNPFSNELNINYYVSEVGEGSIKIFNTNGQLVLNKKLNIVKEGINKFHWNASNSKGAKLEEGLYLIQIKTNSGTQESKVMLTR